jgi:GAF domain-containing protein
LEVGGRSMVGWCTANAQARVAQDVRQETVRVDHPLLAAALSEAALPLAARGRVIGALSVQSDRLGAFDRDTVAVLQTMCDQVAVALDNARLFAESQAALEAERRAYGEIGREAWAEMLREGLAPGYRYVNKQVVPVEDAWQPEMEAALREERKVVGGASETGPAGPVIAAPIKVRGQTIGVIDVRKDAPGTQWTQEEIALLDTLTDQLGLALDSARLYEGTQRLAAREQMINTSTANIRSAATVDAILRRTVEELGRAFSASRASVRLEISEPKQ